MKTRNIFYLFLFILLAFPACDDDISIPDDINSTVDGLYYDIQDFTFLKKEGNKWNEIKEDPLIGGFAFYTDCLWFDNGILTVPATLSEGDNRSISWMIYQEETGKSTDLYVKSPFQYDTITGKLSTEGKILDSEDYDQCYFFVEKATKEQIVLRVELAKSLFDLIDGYRVIYQVATPPSERDVKYETFDSHKEAHEYIDNILGISDSMGEGISN